MSGAEGEVVRSRVDPCGICGKELCLTRCGARSMRSGFMRDAPK